MGDDHVWVPGCDTRLEHTSREWDATLVEAARQNRHAFEPLYEKYANRVYRYARVRTGSDTAAEDILGETMLLAMEGLDHYDARRGSFGGWLITIASRRIVDEHRRQGRFMRLIERLWWPEEVSEDTLTTVIRDDDAIQLRAVLAKLPHPDRNIILLRYHAELSSAEIGQVLGISKNAARVRLMRALRRLARNMESE